jgi:hypothetical protein
MKEEIPWKNRLLLFARVISPDTFYPFSVMILPQRGVLVQEW